MRRNPKLVPTPGIPTFGTTFRLIREDQHHTRQSATNLHGISSSYLFAIESDARPPKLETMSKMLEGYKVGPLLTRHLHDLRSPALDLPTTDRLRQQVRGHNDWIKHLDDLQERRTLAAYVDPFWNILACNESWLAALPGIEKTYSIARWLFSPIAKKVFVQWEREGTHNVAYDKAMLGLFRQSAQARELIKHLHTHPDYRRLWAASIDVNYGRDTDDLLHHHDPATGTLTSYRLSIAPMDESSTVHLVTAIAKPYSGPPFTPR